MVAFLGGWMHLREWGEGREARIEHGTCCVTRSMRGTQTRNQRQWIDNCIWISFFISFSFAPSLRSYYTITHRLHHSIAQRDQLHIFYFCLCRVHNYYISNVWISFYFCRGSREGQTTNTITCRTFSFVYWEKKCFQICMGVSIHNFVHSSTRTQHIFIIFFFFFFSRLLCLLFCARRGARISFSIFIISDFAFCFT